MSIPTQNNLQISENFDDSFAIDLSSTPWATGIIGDIKFSDNIMSRRGIQVRDADMEIDNGDILINGHSLKDFIHNVSERLNILQVNPKLESEWEELRALGQQYRILEQQILEKIAIWDRLKS
jgi:hypothetical protein